MFDRFKTLLELDELVVSLDACCLNSKLFSLPFDRSIPATMRQRTNHWKTPVQKDRKKFIKPKRRFVKSL